MKSHQAEHRVATMCRVLELSTSGYYAWLRRSPSRRAQQDAELSAQLVHFHKASRGTYGAPRLHEDLREAGRCVGRKRVARLMLAVGLRGVSRRKSVRTTTRQPGRRPAPDLVERRFTADGPDQLWVADITYIRTLRGFLYLAVVLDVWSRRIVGWAMRSHLRTELIVSALDMALHQRRPQGVIHHSDQGSQYTSLEFGKRCRAFGVRPSMGSVGDCYDNAMCESFFATLECELLERHRFETHQQARTAVFHFIEGFYNLTHRHSALGYLSPVRFEKEHRQEGCGETCEYPVESLRKIDGPHPPHTHPPRTTTAEGGELKSAES